MSQIFGGSLAGSITLLIGVMIAISLSVLILSGAFDALELPGGTSTTVIPAEEIPDPLTLPNIVALYDAEEDVSIGVGVSQWDDQTGNGNHVVQGTASNQPTVENNAINGNDAISFDGINDYLEVASFHTGALPKPVTLAAVLLPESDATSSHATFFSGANSPNRLAVTQIMTSNLAATFTGTSGVSATVLDDSKFVLLVARQNATFTNIYLDGELILEHGTGGEGVDGMILGAFETLGNDAETQIAYLAVYDGTMSDENMDIFEDYAQDRFDLGMTIQGDYDPEIIITTGNGTSAWGETQETLSTQTQVAIGILALIIIIFAAVIILRVTNNL